MNDCEIFEDDLSEFARGELIEDGRARAIERHISGCVECRQIIEKQEVLTRNFAALRQEPGFEPPTALGASLRTEFRIHRQRVLWRGRAAILGVAACFLFALLWGSHRHSAVTGDEPDDFVPIPFAPPLGNHEHVDIYRVHLSRTALSSFGVSQSSPSSGAVADIAVGEDGIARGIRVVH